MKAPLLTTEIDTESDVVVARQRARLLAQLLGFERQDQTRIATAVSEVARNAFQYATGGRIVFSVNDASGPWFDVLVSDRGPGIADLANVLNRNYDSSTGMGVGLVGARRLMDAFRIDSTPDGGTIVALGKRIPPTAPPLTRDFLARIAERLTERVPQDMMEEVREQNEELLRALEELRARGEQLAKLNRELAETNAGVVALYSELDEKAESVRRSSETKARFFSHMNHEVRTPINSILSLSEILLNGTIVRPLPEQEKPLGLIRKAAHQLSELVSDLLDLAKVESGTMVVRPDQFRAAELFGALRGMFRPLHTNEAVALAFEDCTGLPPLHTDEGKVSQILRNFVSNALKFTEEGEVRVSATADDGFITFAVKDTGIGISAEDQARLFREFSQIENSKQKFIRGTGLGLALSRHLAELLGGRVTVESTLGRGSTFRAIIPIAYAPAASGSGRPADRTTMPPRTSTPPGVLIVDDDEGSRYVLRHALGNLPYAILEAASGSEGLLKAREHQPLVIFLDLSMPGMSGFEVLDLLKEDETTKKIPVIISTARQLTAEERARLQALAVAVLGKSGSVADDIAGVSDALVKAGLPPPRTGEARSGA